MRPVNITITIHDQLAILFVQLDYKFKLDNLLLMTSPHQRIRLISFSSAELNNQNYETSTINFGRFSKNVSTINYLENDTCSFMT